MLQVGQMGLSDAHHEVQRNACFLLGVVYVNMANNPQSVPALAAALSNVLQGLKPLVEGRGQLDHMLVDNACSAVSKGNTLFLVLLHVAAVLVVVGVWTEKMCCSVSFY